MDVNKNTVVDACLKKIPQRFELVILASQRARLLYLGAQSTLKSSNPKASKVEVALEEVARGICTRDSIMHSFKTSVEVFEDNDDEVSDFQIKDIKDGVSYDDFNIEEEDFD